ncbi:peptidase S24/S26A/S26B/S26C [Podospora appendiculata]|uniref:Mitochondrial inner membrane protease subunit 2 n=1 Tax=Podospora appendiculata TaxID=314037 RepID=A0AAE1CBP8_9PEZI|nr:peptidase S24/S26A/S26B/S26C [Podospora appendiculata]
MARWGSAGKTPRFLGQFSGYLFRYATWLPVLIAFNSYVAQVTWIRGPSMYPFLNPHYNESLRKDLCLVSKWSPHRNLERGMIVVFRSPENPHVTVVKRIVGLEGDVVRTKPPYPYEHAKVDVGHVWVEGDGDKTKDSNHYGPVSTGLITGRITHILTPLERAGRVRWWEHAEREGVQEAQAS